MPDRILKESITWSDDIEKLSYFQESFFYRLIVCVDDNGRIDARPAFLRSRMYAIKADMSIEKVEEGLLALENVGLIRFYEVDGKKYLELPTWKDHQNLRYVKHKYPGPEEGKYLSKQNAEDDTSQSKGKPEEASERSMTTEEACGQSKAKSEEADLQSMDLPEEAEKQSSNDECLVFNNFPKISENSGKIKKSAEKGCLEVEVEIEEEVELEVEAEEETEEEAQSESIIERVPDVVPRYEVTFSEFWASYPKKVGKRPCQRKWKNLDPGESLFRKIMQSLEVQKQSRQWTSDGGRYVPNPLTWLNQERWNDELEPAKQRDSIGTIQDALAELERMEHDQA